MLYPSSDNPAFGVFIQREVASLDRYFVQTVIVPKPWRPSEGITSLIEYDAKRASQTTNVEIIYKAYFPLPGTFFLPFKGVWFFLFLIRMVKRMQINFNFDIIHAHNVYPEGFCAILLKKIFNKPVMVTSRGNDLNNYPRYTILQRMIRYVLRNADGVITVSKSLAQRAIALGADPARVSVMRKGVDMEIFKPMRQKEPAS